MTEELLTRGSWKKEIGPWKENGVIGSKKTQQQVGLGLQQGNNVKTGTCVAKIVATKDHH